MLYDYLLETFGKNEPIFLSDIRYKDYSDIWLKKELAKLCDSVWKQYSESKQDH